MSERRRPSPLSHTSLFQLRQPAFWLYAAIVALTGWATLVQQGLFRQISPEGWALSWALMLLYAAPVVTVILVLDLYEREPTSLLVGALVWGGVAATTLAGVANGGWGLVVADLGGPAFAAKWTAALTAPFVEETLKGLGVVLIYLIARGEGMRDRAIKEQADARKHFDSYVRETAGTSSVDELHKLSELKQRGDISQAEFDQAKAKLLA